MIENPVSMTHLYYMFCMPYDDAMNYAKGILNMSEDDLVRHAIMFGLDSSELLDTASYALSLDQDEFYAERNDLCNEKMHMSFQEVSPAFFTFGIHLVLTTCKKEYEYVREYRGRKTRYKVSFDGSSIVATDVDENCRRINIHIHVACIQAANEYGKVSFSFTDSITINMDDITRCSLTDFVNILVKNVCEHMTTCPSNFLSFVNKRLNEMDAIVLYNVVWTDESHIGNWRRVFSCVWHETSTHEMTPKNMKQIHGLLEHPNVNKYEDEDGIVMYLESGGWVPIIALRCVGNGYRIAGRKGNTYERWKLLQRMAG